MRGLNTEKRSVSGTRWRVGFLSDTSFVLVKRRKGVHLHAEDVLLDVVWERLELICGVDVRGDREYCARQQPSAPDHLSDGFEH